MPSQQDVMSLLAILTPHVSARPPMRVGGDGDGAYIIPNDLEGIRGALSIGIGGDVSFDLALAEMGIPIFQYDHTVEGPPVIHEGFAFRKLAWASISGSNTRDLDTMVSESFGDSEGDLLLKFDVEGAEWDALAGVSLATLSRFRIITAEIHGLTALGFDDFYAKVAPVLEAIAVNHVATHIHANNCCGVALVRGVPLPALLEVTFLRKDRSSFEPYRGPLPTQLDRPCVSAEDEIILRPWG